MLATGVHHFSYEERLHAAAWLTFTELVRCWADLIIIISPHTLDCERPEETTQTEQGVG